MSGLKSLAKKPTRRNHEAMHLRSRCPARCGEVMKADVISENVLAFSMWVFAAQGVCFLALGLSITLGSLIDSWREYKFNRKIAKEQAR